MKIIIDGDACPVKEIVIDIAKERNIPVTIFFDTAHVYQNDYADVRFIEKGNDKVDFAILSAVSIGDIVVTNDYGLASMVLAKNAKVVTNFGLEITNFNIEQLLSQRYISAKARKAKIRTKGPKKRTTDDDNNFIKTLLRLL